MAEAQKQFEAWFEEYADENDIRLAINYGAYDIAGDAWQHQQQRIDELEKDAERYRFLRAKALNVQDSLEAFVAIEAIDHIYDSNEIDAAIDKAMAE